VKVRCIERWCAHGQAAASWNELYVGDNWLALSALRERYAAGIDLIYIDPPFLTGEDFAIELPIGTDGGRVRSLAYADRDPDGLDGYLSMLAPRLKVARELLSPRGSLYVHVDHRVHAALRLLLDELFGPRSFVNEIVWAYRTGGVPAKLGYGRKHDNILFYVKDPTLAIWNGQREKSYLAHRYGFSNVQIEEDANGPYTWVSCRDVFDVAALRGNQPERVAYPTQKPEALLERIVLASSEPGSYVLDFFAGSGTTLAVAERLGRRWIGCDKSELAVATTRRRLLERTPRSGVRVLSVAGATEQAPPVSSSQTRIPEGSQGDAETPNLSADLEWIGERLRITLNGLAFSDPKRVRRALKYRDREGRDAELSQLDWVEEWGVQFLSGSVPLEPDAADAAFQADWWHVRSRKTRQLSAQSPLLTCAASDAEVRVRAVTPWGAVAERRLAVPPRAAR
jgi:DNA modification methylase